MTGFDEKITKTGFNLIEVLLVLALIGLLVGITTPVYQVYMARNDLEVTVNTVIQSLRRAEILAQAVDGDMSWGINYNNHILTLFKGVNYVNRDVDFDEIFEVPASISYTGLQEIIFAKFTGLPQVYGTIILTSSTNENRSITINPKGTINY